MLSQGPKGHTLASSKRDSLKFFGINFTLRICAVSFRRCNLGIHPRGALQCCFFNYKLCFGLKFAILG